MFIQDRFSWQPGMPRHARARLGRAGLPGETESFIGTTLALIGMGIAAASSVAGAAISAHGAHSAANAQVAAAQQAAEDAKSGAASANQVLGTVNTNNQTLLKPWQTPGQGSLAGFTPYTTAGANAITTLNTDLAPGGSLTKPFTASDMTQYDPGYQFRIEQSQQALERAAAATGTLQNGGTQKDLVNYIQGAASSEYQNAFQRYLAQNQQTYNMLSGTAGMGLNANNLESGLAMGATNTGVQSNEFYGAGVSQNTMTAAELEAQAAVGAGNARAAGIVGGSNAWGGALANIGNSLNQSINLSQMMGQLGAAPSEAGTAPVYNPLSLPGVGTSPVTTQPVIAPPPTLSNATGYGSNSFGGGSGLDPVSLQKQVLLSSLMNQGRV